MNIEQIPIYDIKPYENNAKKHTDAQLRKYIFTEERPSLKRNELLQLGVT